MSSLPKCSWEEEEQEEDIDDNDDDRCDDANEKEAEEAVDSAERAAFDWGTFADRLRRERESRRSAVAASR